MTHSRAVRTTAVLLAAFTAFGGSAALAKKGKERKPKTHAHKVKTEMRFKLDDHTVGVGDSVTGAVRLYERVRSVRTPMAGVDVSISVNKEDMGLFTTDENGMVAIDHADRAGQYVMRILYAGDETHKSVKRAQGFEIGDFEDPEDVEDV